MGDSHDDLVYRACLMSIEENGKIVETGKKRILDSHNAWKARAIAAEKKLDWLLVQATRGVLPGWICIPEVEWAEIYPPNAESEALT